MFVCYNIPVFQISTLSIRSAPATRGVCRCSVSNALPKMLVITECIPKNPDTHTQTNRAGLVNLIDLRAVQTAHKHTHAKNAQHIFELFDHVNSNVNQHNNIVGISTNHRTASYKQTRTDITHTHKKSAHTMLHAKNPGNNCVYMLKTRVSTYIRMFVQITINNIQHSGRSGLQHIFCFVRVFVRFISDFFFSVGLRVEKIYIVAHYGTETPS